MLWRDKIKLGKLWRFFFLSTEIGGPLLVAVLQFYLGTSKEMDSNIKSIAIIISLAVFTVFLVHRVLDAWGTYEKPIVDALLERLGNEIWERPPSKLSGSIERHRITLFRLQRRWFCTFRKKWTHVLCPCTRSPRSGRRPTRCFHVHDHFQENCEGIAGLVFSSGGKSLTSPLLPDLHNSNVTEEDYADYATKTNDTVDRVKAEKYYSRVIGGVTVYKNGERWGVLILDSVDPNALVDGTLDGVAMKRTLELLVDVLS